ncbi:MAG: hypothetical protein V1889_00475 [archaeon]
MEEGDLVLCKVEQVTNTITSVKTPDGHEGTIISSEIAPGRIKLMRQYVVPNKQIVCKILKIEGNRIHLSLRRVTSKEKKEVMQKYKQAQAINVAFKQILGEKEEQTKEKILKDFKDLSEFINKIKEDEKILSKYIPKEKQEAIKKVSEKKKKKHRIKTKHQNQMPRRRWGKKNKKNLRPRRQKHFNHLHLGRKFQIKINNRRF